MNDSTTLPMDDGRFPTSSSTAMNTTAIRHEDGEDDDDEQQQIVVGQQNNKNKRYGVVDRRAANQQKRARAEQRSLLGSAERDDSDLEPNIGRLCQYLSGSEDEDNQQDDRRQVIDHHHANGSTSILVQRPSGLFVLNSRQIQNQNNHHHRNTFDGAGDSNGRSSSSLISDENFNTTTNSSSENMPGQHQQQITNNFAQVIPMQRLVPRDFLNIPPPAQPPPLDDDELDSPRPLPPQRTLPPLPDEPLYEEAKPASGPPPPPMPRPSKQQQYPQSSLGRNGATSIGTNPSSSNKASAVVSPVMASSFHHQHHHPASMHMDDDMLLSSTASKPLCLSQGSQYNQIDWHNYETSILERNEAGSFYIPSGQTTMSSISPSRKSEMDHLKHNNYLLSPAGGGGMQHHGSSATVPVPPMLPTQAPLNNRSRPSNSTNLTTTNQMNSKTKLASASSWNNGGGRKRAANCCSWKLMAYGLAGTLVFVLAVLAYLLHLVFSPPAQLNPSSSSLSPSYHSPSGAGAPDDGSLGGTSSSMLLRPLPESISLGDEVVADLLPQQLSHTYFTMQRNSYVQFNVSLVDAQTNLAFYGRQTLAASPTQYDFVRIVNGAKFHTRRFDSGARTSRAAVGHRLPENARSTAFVQYLSGGRWHLSILNDDTDIRTVRFSASLTDKEREECKNNCHNKGVCKEGKCYCFDGFTGTYCEETFCPVLCSGNGIFAAGKCHCHHGWKGADCDVQSNMCEVPNCNGHGQCNNKGECQCDRGYKGPFCEQRECPHENCSGHGVCQNGKCYCDFGYKGEKCDVVYTASGLCPSSSSSSSSSSSMASGGGGGDASSECNGRGRVDPSSTNGQCKCNDGWIGEKCQNKLCHMNCGPRGRCINDACSCDDGYTGERCQLLACSPGCEENGRCSNGTCQCNEGWNGDNCQLAGCPQSCNRHGECKRNVSGQWRCSCQAGFGGEDCSIPLERQCSDGVDNDGDGLTDCEDSECCSNINCQNDQYCRTVPDPYQVLIRKQSLPPHASFSQKISFLLDPDSVQQYPDPSLFNESRVSVIRGRVLNARGGGSLMAVRIANAANALFGFTLSRAGGYFDLVVDGGGAITLQFMRKPFATQYVTVRVPWNQIVYVGDVMMTTKEDSSIIKDPSADRLSPTCSEVLKAHSIKPFAIPAWKYGRRGATSSISGVIADAGSVQASARIPGTDIHLTYTSTDAPGRDAILSLYLVPERVPSNLRRVRLVVDLEGGHFETELEAKPNLTYVYGWQKRNVYKQQISGLARGEIRVGYVYAKCERTFWERMRVKFNGHAGSISDIGGWNLNIHHRYNILDSVLEKGDGGAVYLREELSTLANTIGSKEQRSITCQANNCNGPAATARLYLPMALATSRDGDLFVGDYNLVRRWSQQNNQLITVLELSISDTAHRYYMTTHPITGELYLSLPLRRQIWKVRSTSPSSADVSSNFEVVAGSGEICAVDSDCGDGGTSELAALTYPKGIAFDSNGNLFVADDRRIRLITTSGFVSTILGGSQEHASTPSWHALPCSTIFSSGIFRPQWPTSLSFDQTTETLLFLDTDVVFELIMNSNSVVEPSNKRDAVDQSPTGDEHLIRIKAGAPSHCSQLIDYATNETRRPSILKGASALATTDDGRILVAETDRKRIHRIRMFDRYGRASVLAGIESKCDCHRKNCPCDDDDGSSTSEDLFKNGIPAKRAHFHNPSSLAVDQRGNVHVADEGNYKVRTLKYDVPSLDARTKLYEIVAPDSQETYYFNRFGQHVSTKDMLTDRYVYNFTYHVDTSYGKLNQVTGAGGHKLYLIRKSSSKILFENTNGMKSTAYVGQFENLLDRLVGPNGAETRFEYEPNTGLLTSKFDALQRRAWFYEYDRYGRVEKSILPTGEILSIKYGLMEDRLLVNVENERGFDWNLSVSSSEMKVRGEPRDRSIYYYSPSGDAIYQLSTPDNVSVQYEGGVHSFADLSTQSTALLRRKLILPATTGEPSRSSRTSKLEWRYYAKRTGRSTNYKRVAQVNGVNVLTIEYDREKNLDIIFNQNNDKILTIYYNSAGFVTQWSSSSPANVGMFNITYDQMGRVINQNWASIGRSFSYDRFGRLIEMGDSLLDASSATKKAKRFGYDGENALPSTIDTPSGSRYRLRYDSYGNMVNATSPSGIVHSYQQQIDLASAINLIYTRSSTNSSISSKSHVLSKRFDGKPLATYFGDGRKRVAYFYDQTSRLTSIVHDRSEMRFEYDSTSGHLIRMESVDENDSEATAIKSEVKYGYQGDLLVEILDRRSISTHWYYQYDDRLRLNSIQTIVDDESTWESYKIEYDSLTGRVLSINSNQIQYLDQQQQRKIRIQNDRFSVELATNSNTQLSHAKYVVQGRTISEQRIFYDNRGRMTNADLKIDGDAGSMNYEYDAEGRIAAARLSNQGVDHSWTYSYDADGSLEKINDVPIEKDESNGQATSYGKLEYVSDSNGFVTERKSIGTSTSEYFEYDSFGRLIRARRGSPDSDGGYDTRYRYDHRNRLITVERTKKSVRTVWHFYYALLDRPQLITHAYEAINRARIVYTYDVFDRLVSMEASGNRYVVITLANGTPMHVFAADDGSATKTMIRSPYGAVTMDSAPDFQLFIGYRGWYQDVDNRMVIDHDGRPYDPDLARYVSARVDDYFRVDPFEPEATLDPFEIEKRNVVANRAPGFDLGVSDFLRFNGYEIDDILPLYSSSSKESTLACGGNNPAQLYVSSECYLERKIAAFHTLLSVHPSPLLTSGRRSASSTSITFTPAPSVWLDSDRYHLLAVDRNNLTRIYSSRSTNPEQSTTSSIIADLLNQSIALPLNFWNSQTADDRDGGELIRYFWKKDFYQSNRDWSKLNSETTTNDGWKVLNPNTNVSMNSMKSRNEIVLKSPRSIVHLRYGGGANGNFETEINGLLDEFRDEFVDVARKNLKLTADESRKFEFRREPFSHSALFNDPNNIRFVKKR